MEATQLLMELPAHASEVEAAFENGVLSLLVTERGRYDSRSWGGHAGAGAKISYDGPFASVHVMSRPAGGEIRGYVRINGVLHLRLPAYPSQWDELDIEVSRRLSCPVKTSDVSQ